MNNWVFAQDEDLDKDDIRVLDSAVKSMKSFGAGSVTLSALDDNDLPLAVYHLFLIEDSGIISASVFKFDYEKEGEKYTVLSGSLQQS